MILKYFSVHVKSLLHTLLDIFLKIVLPLFLLLLKITSDIIFEYDFHTCNQNSSYHFLYWMYTLLWLAVYRKLVQITHLKRPNNITDLCLYQRGGGGRAGGGRRRIHLLVHNICMSFVPPFSLVVLVTFVLHGFLINIIKKEDLEVYVYLEEIFHTFVSLLIFMIKS